MVGGIEEKIDRKKIVVLAISCILLTGIAGFLFHQYGYGPLKIIRYLVLIYGLLAVAVIDARKRIIPNKILIWMMLIRAVILVLEMYTYPANGFYILEIFVIGMFLGGGIFLITYFASRKSMGLGDVKLSGVMGFYLGSTLIIADLIVCLACSAIYSIIMLCTKKLKAKDSIPFAPFLAIGTVVVLLIGC